LHDADEDRQPELALGDDLAVVLVVDAVGAVEALGDHRRERGALEREVHLARDLLESVLHDDQRDGIDGAHAASACREGGPSANAAWPPIARSPTGTSRLGRGEISARCRPPRPGTTIWRLSCASWTWVIDAGPPRCRGLRSRRPRSRTHRCIVPHRAAGLWSVADRSCRAHRACVAAEPPPADLSGVTVHADAWSDRPLGRDRRRQL